MSSRLIEDLRADMQELTRAFLRNCEAENFDVLIYCTVRDNAEQAKLFRQGRSLSQISRMHDTLAQAYKRPDLGDLLMSVGPQNGAKLTNAAPGMSLHNYRLAFDGCPLQAGKLIWTKDDLEDDQLWERYGQIAESVGLEWAGRWRSFKEKPHVQMRGVRWEELIRAA